MTLNRRWTSLLIAGWLSASQSVAQEESGGTTGSSSSSSSGASSAFGADSFSGAGSSGGATGAESGSGSGTSNTGTSFGSGGTGTGSGTGAGTGSSGGSGGTGGTGGGTPSFGTPGFGAPTAPPTAPGGFGFGSPGFGPSTTPATPGVGGTGPNNTAPPGSDVPGSSSAFGASGGEGAPRQEAAPTFTMPGAYGQASQTFTPGEGRLARPRFRYTTSLSVGYDDNVLQTPTNSQPIPEIRQEVIVDLGTPPLFIPTIEEIVIQEEIPRQERIGSFFARASGSFEMQFASRRTVFTLDLRGNADQYFSRPSDQTDFSGSLGFTYIHRITPRMQFSAGVSVSYLSQPDVRLLNTPTRNVGDFLNIASKFDLSYRWTRRFSTVSSISLNSLLYMEEAQKSGDYYETTFGTEARYLWSPRLTVLAETRFALTRYPEDQTRDSHTIYLLGGGEYVLTRRIGTSIRAGASMRSFEQAGGSSISPYFEGTVSWQLTPVSFLTWNNRFGFEEAPDAQSEVLSFRSGLNVIQAFSSRLRGSVGLTYIHRTTTNEVQVEDFTEQTIDANVGLQYQFSKRFSLNAAYTFTNVFTSTEVTDYYRNRIFLGAEYAF